MTDFRAETRKRIGHKPSAIPVPVDVIGEQSLANVPVGPNAAHPNTQTVSNPHYLRPKADIGKQVSGKPRKAVCKAVRGVGIKFRLTTRS